MDWRSRRTRFGARPRCPWRCPWGGVSSALEGLRRNRVRLAPHETAEIHVPDACSPWSPPVEGLQGRSPGRGTAAQSWPGGARDAGRPRARQAVAWRDRVVCRAVATARGPQVQHVTARRRWRPLAPARAVACLHGRRRSRAGRIRRGWVGSALEGLRLPKRRTAHASRSGRNSRSGCIVSLESSSGGLQGRSPGRRTAAQSWPGGDRDAHRPCARQAVGLA